MSCLKMIRGANEHDNFSKGLSMNLITPIDLTTGRLRAAWGSLASDWPRMTQYAYHPDSRKQIEGFSVPYWSEVKDLAIRAQQSFSSLPTVGWDIAITNEGILIVEANTAYDAASFQLFEGRGLRGEFQRLYRS